MSRKRIGFLRILVAVLTTGSIDASVRAEAPNFEKDVLPYFNAHCIRCHGPKLQESSFRIDTLSRNVGRENTPQWAEIRERINSGEMPPQDEKTLPTAGKVRSHGLKRLGA